MPILRERKTWKRNRAPRLADRLDRLTPDEEANVRAAMRVLRKQHGGTWRRVARAMGAGSENRMEASIPRDKRPVTGLPTIGEWGNFLSVEAP